MMIFHVLICHYKLYSHTHSPQSRPTNLPSCPIPSHALSTKMSHNRAVCREGFRAIGTAQHHAKSASFVIRSAAPGRLTDNFKVKLGHARSNNDTPLFAVVADTDADNVINQIFPFFVDKIRGAVKKF